MRYERDSQRAKFYRAIREVTTEPAGDDITKVHKWAIKTMRRRALERRFGRMASYDLEVTNWFGSSRSRARPANSEIFIAPSDYQKHKVLWLVAYIVHREVRLGYTAPDFPFLRKGGEPYLEFTGKAAPWHGWQYCHIYMLLVRYGIGKEAADDLKAAFKKHGVRYLPKRSRKASPNQLAALRAARMERNKDVIEEKWTRVKRRKRKISL